MNKPIKQLNDSLLDLHPDLIIQHCAITPYKIKLKKPLHTASSSLYFREGLLIKLTANVLSTNTLTTNSISTSSAYSAIGECAPMIEIGTESLLQAQQFLEKKSASITGQHLSAELLSDMDKFPACRFALESALLSLIAQHSHKNIAGLLNSELLNSEVTPKIKVNTMLGALNSDTLVQVKQAETNGFNCIKIKLGLNSIETEAQQLKDLLETILPSTLMRLDANKSWTLEQSEWLLNFLKPYERQIDGIEEPLKVFDNTAYQYLQSNTAIALALDESFSSSDSLNTYPVKRLILKPMAQGGLLNTLERVRQAQQLNIETIVTSSIESGYGLWAISYLCAAINNQQYHGIATASWLEETLIKPPEITHGIITL